MNKSRAAPSRYAMPWLLALFAPLFALMLLLAGGAYLSYEYQVRDEELDRQAQEQAQQLATHAARSFDPAREAARRIGLAVRAGGGGGRASRSEAARLLRELLPGAPQIRRAALIDVAGGVIADSYGGPAPGGVSLADRDYLLHHRDGKGAELFIGRAVASPLASDRGDREDRDDRSNRGDRRDAAASETIMPVTLALRENGALTGVVEVALSAAHFGDYYDLLRQGGLETLRLLRSDGVMLAGAGDPADDLAVWREIAATPQSTSSGIVRAAPGSSMRTAWQRVNGYPLVVSAGYDERVWFQGWHRLLVAGGLIGVLAVASLIGLGALLQRADRRARELDQARSKLALSETRLAAALDTLPHAFSLWDREGRLVMYNAAHVSMFPAATAVRDRLGMSFEEMVRANVEAGHIADPPPLAEREAWIATRVARFNNPSGPHEIRGADGRWVQMHEHRTPSGEIIHMSVDITEQRTVDDRIRESEALYRNALDALHEGVYMRDRAGVIVAINKSAERIFGREASRIIGCKSLAPEYGFYNEDGSPLDASERPGMRVLRDGGESGIVSRVVRPDGVELWLSVTARAVLAPGDVQPVAAVVSFSDITARYQAEKALKESEARYRAVIETMGDAVIVRKSDMCIVACNKAAEILFGMSRDRIIGQKSLVPPLRLIREDGTVLPRELVPGWRALHERIAQEDVTYGIEREDGSVVWVVVSARPIFRPGEHEPFAVVSSNRNITLRREAEAKLRDAQEANHRLLTALQQSQDAIFTKDMEARITSWNAGAERIFGFGAEEAIGRSLRELQLRHVSDARYQAVLDRVRAGRAAAFESDQMTKSGRLITVWTVAEPLRDRDGTQVGEITTIRDITELREAQRAVETSNRELERRVTQRTAELEAAVTELQSFSYSVSHDLRAPLRAIDGFSRILAETQSQALGEEGIGYIDRVRAQVARMTQLIDDLLKLSRVTQAGIARGEFNLSDLAETILGEQAQAEPERRIDWKVEGGLLVNADPGLARIMLQNLLSNAWKFTAKAEHGHIGVGIIDTPRGRAMFVRDNGVGFDMQYAGKLFGAFQRMHSEKEFPGTGIGLATVKRIVMRHGGDCWAESTPRGGTSIYFILP